MFEATKNGRGKGARTGHISKSRDDAASVFKVSKNLIQQAKAVGVKVKGLYAEQAKERQKATLKKGNEKPVPANLPERNGDARDKAGEAVKVSGKVQITVENRTAAGRLRALKSFRAKAQHL